MVISMLKIRRPLGRLIFNMGIAIPGKTVFLIEMAPWLLWNLSIHNWEQPAVFNNHQPATVNTTTDQGSGSKARADLNHIKTYSHAQLYNINTSSAARLIKDDMVSLKARKHA